MADVRARVQKNVALAQQINGQIRERGDQYVYAVDNISPGAGTSAQAAAVPTVSPRPAVTRRPAAIKLRPDPSAPDIAQLPARTSVTAERARGGYTLVQTSSGTEGYVAVGDLQGNLPTASEPRPTRTVTPTRNAPGGASPAASPQSTAEVRTLAGSNAARRDTFAESVSVTDKAAKSSFELAA
jgi:hypothetical protein